MDVRHIPSPPVETKEGHRLIPDDTHQSQASSNTTMSFHSLWHVKRAASQPIVEEKEVSTKSSVGFIRNPADHS